MYAHIHICINIHIHMYMHIKDTPTYVHAHTHIYTEIIMDDVKKNKVRGLREVRGRKTDASD